MKTQFRFELNMKKRCFKCGKIKALSKFYKHSRMADGHLNKCIECAKVDVVTNRAKKLDYYIAYDRARNSSPHRVSARIRYQPKSRSEHPGKYRCRTVIANALAEGKLHRQNCYRCGDPNTTAHHVDYRKPLHVTWLCWKHHGEAHRKYDYEALISQSHLLKQKAEPRTVAT